MINYSPGGLASSTRISQTKPFFQNIAAGAILNIWTPTAGKRLIIYGLIVSCAVNGDFLIRNNAGSKTLFRGYCLANQPVPIILPVNGFDGFVVDEVLSIQNNLGVAAIYQGAVWGDEE